VLGRRERVVDTESGAQLVAPSWLTPLEQPEVAGHALRLEEPDAVAGRREEVPADGDAVAPHVRQDAPALANRIPEPRLVRAAVLLGGTRQHGWAHALDH